ncbi:M23 family metallopeptidase [Cohnella sp. WQ 127256]|uniref:M23 family metallopeptidase n=1 Tax=Cohnella sp. WQ 127256 TaxID=2938790 RepID=UPI0021197648|nr:peptidoglycan DD-metalloendopeptidase family protein [Cohnella sp. WQ 127256]
MAHRTRKDKWSLLLIRDADRRVKQYRVSRRMVVCLPLTAAIAVAGGFAYLELKSTNRIHDLEFLLAQETALNDNIVAGKNSEVKSLQQNLRLLNSQTNRLQTRMNELSELEGKLRQFIGKYGDPTADSSLAEYSPASEVAASVVSSTLQSDRLYSAATESTITDFIELSQMLDGMANAMEDNLRKAELKRAEIAAIPSEWPTVSRRLTSGFGYRTDPITGQSTFHAGVDITGDIGDRIYAAGDGKVRDAGFNRTRGNYIIITHRNGLESWYMHLSVIGVKISQQVKRGDLIGEMGNSGRSTGPHLHFQIVASEEPVNPLPYLRQVKED